MALPPITLFLGAPAVVAASRFPTYKVEVDWSAKASGVFRLDESALDGTDGLAAGLIPATFSSPEADVSARLDTMEGTRGREDAFGPMAMGEYTVLLEDAAGDFNPDNTSSPVAGNVLPMRQVRIRAEVDATLYPIFYGFARRIVHQADRRRTRLEVVDGFHLFNAEKPVVEEVANRRTGELILLILGAIGWNDPAFLDVSELDGDIVPAFSADGSKSALVLIAELLEVERGTFYIARDGKATYEPRSGRSTKTSGVTIADAAENIEPSVDVELVGNRARVTKTGSTEQSYTDGESEDTYGTRDIQAIESPYLLNDDQADSLARHLVAQQKDPRPPAHEFALVNHDAATLIAMLEREVGDRVTLQHTTSGTDADYFVEQISHRVDGGGSPHRSFWQLTQRGAGEAFQLDVSELDGTDVLTY